MRIACAARSRDFCFANRLSFVYAYATCKCTCDDDEDDDDDDYCLVLLTTMTILSFLLHTYTLLLNHIYTPMRVYLSFYLVSYNHPC